MEMPNAQQLSLHVRTSLWNKTTHDPHNNILRATVEALAGVLGGCDSMQVGAFDEVVRQPDDFSRRIARNTQLILQKECNLDARHRSGWRFVVRRGAHRRTRQSRMDAFSGSGKTGRHGSRALRAGFPQESGRGESAAERLKAVASRAIRSSASINTPIQKKSRSNGLRL